MEKTRELILANICLILENTYPYVTGGVSNWVQMLISGLPEFDFSIANLYTGVEPKQLKYEIPKNVKQINKISIMADEKNSDLLRQVSKVPQANIYHALSTGFAGLFGSEIKRQKKLPFILTEHGIYWHEVALGADELECGFKIIKTREGEIVLGRTWASWLKTFKDFARETYLCADEITTVCRSNLKKQISLDADANKCSVINNGVNQQNFLQKNEKIKPENPVKIGLVGRVTPIKDIETFIRACYNVKKEIPRAQFYIIRPTDHDQAYFQKCLELRDKLNLTDLIFMGEMDTSQIYQQFDLIVLTSKSEGQPFVLIESMAAGVPVVATDVGGCGDLVYGCEDDFGDAGKICTVGDVDGISAAMIFLVTNTDAWKKCSDTARKRVNQFYVYEQFLNSYRNIYLKYLDPVLA